MASKVRLKVGRIVLVLLLFVVVFIVAYFISAITIGIVSGVTLMPLGIDLAPGTIGSVVMKLLAVLIAGWVTWKYLVKHTEEESA